MKDEQEFKAKGGKSNPLLLEMGVPRALAAVNRVLDYGAEKYAAHSWQRVDVERYNFAARRHRIARDLGEARDLESGLLYLAHEAANILFQLEMMCRIQGMDWQIYNPPPQSHKSPPRRKR
ncbi:MAG: hypothetical protein COB16_10755 [Rhodobacteraceae bacterium]|nr:MAG: hypothetical protein COB16_10755 [Paracoccaceae bacterium]